MVTVYDFLKEFDEWQLIEYIDKETGLMILERQL
jgi:hypothetical protein